MAESPPPVPQEPPPFRVLGFLNGVYYYYSRGEQAVVALQSGGHGKKAFYRLARHSYWVNKYPGKKDDFDENAAASALIQACHAAGIFSISRIRGRGVWMDGKSSVIHYGDKVSINGKDYLPFLTPGKQVYELGEALGFEPCKPLPDTDSSRLPGLISMLKWESPEHAVWFSGWLACALIGGALSWRPHIWLTGGAQSGKTTLSGIIKSFLRNNCLYIKSVSTEAGIRQTLKADCLAVVMDEAEREDSTSHSRIQSILTLARQASSDDDSRIVKGTPTGNALNFQIRSPFCLSSINSALIQTADKSRFTNIELSGKKLAGDEYKEWKSKISALMTDEYIQAAYQRIFAMVPTLTANAKELAYAIEAKTGDRRLGDQYGALLAGYRSFYENKLLSTEDAKWLVDPFTFSNEREQSSGINDQHSLLNKIMQHVMKVPKEKGYEDVSIAEMCQRVHKNRDFNNECKISLGNIGIKVTDTHVIIGNDNDNLADILSHSRWPHNWQQTLKRLAFAEPSRGPVYFSPACKCRAIEIPLENAIQEDEPAAQLKLVAPPA